MYIQRGIMEKRISGFKTITFAGFTALLLLSGCATTKPVASKNTPQQLIMQNRKAEAMQEFAKTLIVYNTNAQAYFG